MTKDLLNLSEIEKIVNETILEQAEIEEEMGIVEYNVVGIVVYGSYVKGLQTPESDIDYIILTRDNDSSHVDDFRGILADELMIRPDDGLSSCQYTDAECLRSYLDLLGGHYKVISPYEKVKKFVESVLKEE